MVTDDSATFVARTILRRFAGRTARVCSSSGRSPCSGSIRRSRGPRQLRQRRLGTADLAGAGEEHQQIPVRLLAQQAPYRAGHLPVQRAIVGIREVLDRDLEGPPLAANQRAVEEGAHRLGVQRRRHGEDGEVGAIGRAQVVHPGEGEIGRDVPLVELVEDHGGHAGERGRGDHAAEEQPLGEELHAGAGTDRFVEAHRVPDLVAHLLSQLRRDTGGGQTRGEPARLQHPDVARRAATGVEERARHPGRLARAGRRFDHHRAAVSDGAHHLGENVVYREPRERGHGRSPAVGGRWQVIRRQHTACGATRSRSRWTRGRARSGRW